MEQQTQQNKNTIFSLLKHIFVVCKTQHFLFLNHANSYNNIVALLQVLFCYPFYILYPNKLFKIAFGHTSQTITPHIPKKQTRFKNMLHKGLIGLLFGFLFWLPFWWFILATILPTLLYWILCGIFICFILYCCILLICLRATSQMNNRLLCNMPISFNKDYFTNAIIPYFIIFVIICVGIFSLFHKNMYIGVSLCYPLSIAIFLFMPRVYRFWFGFFIGVFGFYWMALSFRFQDLEVLIPFVIIAIGVIYGILMWFLCYFQNLTCRFFAIILLFIIHPLDFNWLNIVYFSSYSVFEASFVGIICVGLACYLIIAKSALRILAPLFLLMSIDYDMQIQEPKLKAKIIETKYPQDAKWLPKHKKHIVENNLDIIYSAINEGYPIVILPETSFPFILNKETGLYDVLLDLSHNITIIVGSMRFKDSAMTYPKGQQQYKFMLDTLPQISNVNTPEESFINMPNAKEGYYNTTYIFARGNSIIADKNELVPFGETLPLNNLLSPIFELIFGDTFGFNKGNGIVTFVSQGLNISIANCYEGTMNLPYTTGSKYIIMLSNNAWFKPSTQYFMQQMIAKYYARNYKTFIYHSTNETPKIIITPNNGKD